MEIQGDKAEFWWWCYIVSRIGIFGFLAYITLINEFTYVATLFVSGMSILSSLIQWHADCLKGNFQSTLRKLEFRDGLCWQISSRERSEWLVKLSCEQFQNVIATDSIPENYFASNKRASVERLTENLEESSWWSKQLAGRMAIVYAVFFTSIVIACVMLLVLSRRSTLNETQMQNVAIVVLSTIAALFTIGFIRLTVEYLMFWFASSKVEAGVCKILDDGYRIPEEEAIKLVHEYQSARSGSPMIPNRMWKINEKKLNDIWLTQRLRD